MRTRARSPIFRLNRWRALTLRERLLRGEAMAYLLWADVLVHLVPVRHWRSNLASPDQGAAPVPVLRDTKRAVERAARHCPTPAKCLSQALAASWMLRRRGITGTINLGTARDAAGRLAFHAWLTVGPHIVTGPVDEAAFARFRPCLPRRARP